VLSVIDVKRYVDGNVDGSEPTPDCGWANFSMVMHDRGIRRRLAPMLGDDPNRPDAFAAGAPVLVYGDEIGMGDDLDQPDRISVRIPMQWTSGKNGGFWTSALSKLIQSVLRTGPFSYDKINVEDQK
jgi:maltose alpha-D-glucosyltransferase/alpha-amylase